MATKAKPEIRSVSLSVRLKELRKTVKNYEEKYQCASDEMLQAVRAGKAHETIEVSTWLMDYRILKKWEGRSGRTTGIRGKTTRRFTPVIWPASRMKGLLWKIALPSKR